MKGSGIFVGLVLSALVAGCSGGGGGGGCFMQGQACSFPTQCCGGLTCDANSKTCTSGNNMCANTGQSCGGSIACCQGQGTCVMGTCKAANQCAAQGQDCSSTACCQGLTCMNGSCAQMQSCASTGQSCANLACCQGLQCSNGTCMGQDTRKAFGQGPCAQQADCMTNVCITFGGYPNEGECSAGCNNSVQCAQFGGTTPYFCIQGQSSNFCLRQCTSSGQCSDIGADWSCDVGQNTEGGLQGLCGIYKGLAEGQACKDSTQCAGGFCNGAWCTADAPHCGSDAACGQFAVCIQDQNNENSCFPKCTTNNDCLQFNVLSGLNTTCKGPATTVNQQMVMVCSS
jgi:hypothetical protein